MRRLTLVILVLVANCFSEPLAGQEKSRSAAPNVLFIAVDDLRPELGCYGTRAQTPNIDRLAASGLQFDRAYCNQAVCGASRVSLMTGLYPEFTGERTFHVTDWRTRWAKVVTLNQHFKSNGYTTIGLGKIYHGKMGPGVDPDNWTEWVKVGGKEYGDPASLKNRRKRNGRRRGPATESADVPDGNHFDGNRARVGAARLKQLAAAGKPFFLAVGFTKPHLPFVA
ncbi:MAG: sulfatase-like hydrolase/transferase, partial [Planctomycetota bacterium]|nr:sulfatase-like hydrolase/transferase [Planctomycetota bacterium]